MSEKTEAWKAVDGSLFLEKSDSSTHDEFEEFREWYLKGDTPVSDFWMFQFLMLHREEITKLFEDKSK